MSFQLSLFETKYSINQIINWVGEEWAKYLHQEFESKYMIDLFNKIREDKKTNVVVPESKDVFKLYKLLPPSFVKVVILSQSPYPSLQADGIAFSSKYGVPLSLKRIQNSLGTKERDLTYLVEQGVWLQNTILTANTKDSLAHKNWGWEKFVLKTIEVISHLNQRLVWIALGSESFRLISKVVKPTDLLLRVSHPVSKKSSDSWSFKEELEQCNQFLEKYGEKSINWSGYKK